MKEVQTSYIFSPSSGEIRVTLFNVSPRTVVIAARTFLLCVRSLGGLEIKRLNSFGKNRKEIKTQHFLCTLSDDHEFSKISDPKYWESCFPSVFSDPDGQGPTEAMKKLAVSMRDVRIKTPLHTDFGLDFTVDHLAPKEWIDEAFHKYLKAGYFSEVPEGKWVYKNPSLFLPKFRRQQIRWLRDLRQLNSHFSLPRSDFVSVREVLRRIRPSWVYFVVLDIADGFFSLPLRPELTEFFGFNYGDKLYQWNVLPQGFIASSGLFHQRLSYILRNHEAINYMDDVLLGSDTIDGLQHSLHSLFEIFAKYGLRIQKKKLRFGNGSIEFLGWDILSGGRVTCSTYMKSKENLIGRAVTCVRDLQSILGMFNTVRKYIPQFSLLVSPLFKFLKCKNFFPSKEVEPLVIEVWQKLFSTFQVCHLPDDRIESWHLYSDWSEGQLGYCLFFKAMGTFRLCDINSCLKREALAVSSFLGELMGIRYALNSVRYLLSSAPLHVYCDNQGVVTKLNGFVDDFSDVRVSRLVSWLFSNFPDIHISYFPGGLNKIADSLSRLPTLPFRPKSMGMIVPLAVDQLEALRASHAGHFSAHTTYEHLKADGYFWPQMWEDTLEFCKHCERCQLFSSIQRTPEWGDLCGKFPFHLVYADFAGPLRWMGKQRSFYICVIVDSFSKFMFTRMCQGCRAQDALLTFNQFVEYHGVPQRLQTDRGLLLLVRLLEIDLDVWAQPSSFLLLGSPKAMPL